MFPKKMKWKPWSGNASRFTAGSILLSIMQGLVPTGHAIRLLRLRSIPEEAWRRMLDINLTGVFHCLKFEIRQMLKQKSGAIVNNASVGACRGNYGFSPYNASKSGTGLLKPGSGHRKCSSWNPDQHHSAGTHGKNLFNGKFCQIPPTGRILKTWFLCEGLRNRKKWRKPSCGSVRMRLLSSRASPCR